MSKASSDVFWSLHNSNAFMIKWASSCITGAYKMLITNHANLSEGVSMLPPQLMMSNCGQWSYCTLWCASHGNNILERQQNCCEVMWQTSHKPPFVPNNNNWQWQLLIALFKCLWYCCHNDIGICLNVTTQNCISQVCSAHWIPKLQIHTVQFCHPFKYSNSWYPIDCLQEAPWLRNMSKMWQCCMWSMKLQYNMITQKHEIFSTYSVDDIDIAQRGWDSSFQSLYPFVHRGFCKYDLDKIHRQSCDNWGP